MQYLPTALDMAHQACIHKMCLESHSAALYHVVRIVCIHVYKTRATTAIAMQHLDCLHYTHMIDTGSFILIKHQVLQMLQ